MREIITLQVGQCGNRVGLRFWELISDEHGINRNQEPCPFISGQEKRLSIYFKETLDNTYSPRAILTDLEPGVLDTIQADECSQIFNAESFISGTVGAGNNFAKGYFLTEPELLDSLMEMIRVEVEACDALQGFQVVHSLGGGTGSGLGTLLMIHMKENYPDSMMNNYSVMPSNKVSDVVVEPYNTVLALRHITEYSDSTYCIDNEALFNICHYNLKINQPQFTDLNHLISTAMSGITTCFRFPSEMNTDLRKLAVNMVPYPRLHFYIPGILPFPARLGQTKQSLSVKELTKGILDEKNMLAACNPKSGRYLTIAAMFRGKMSTTEVEHEVKNLQDENSDHFVEWLSNNVKLSVCRIPTCDHSDSATFVGNTTCVQELFSRILLQFQIMQRRKAYIHWYTGEGLPEEEFNLAEESLAGLIADYQQEAETI